MPSNCRVTEIISLRALNRIVQSGCRTVSPLKYNSKSACGAVTPRSVNDTSSTENCMKVESDCINDTVAGPSISPMPRRDDPRMSMPPSYRKHPNRLSKTTAAWLQRTTGIACSAAPFLVRACLSASLITAAVRRRNETRRCPTENHLSKNRA